MNLINLVKTTKNAFKCPDGRRRLLQVNKESQEVTILTYTIVKCEVCGVSYVVTLTLEKRIASRVPL